MIELTLWPTEQEAGKRIDCYLAETIDGLTRSNAQTLLRNGAVTLNGCSLKKNMRLSGGEEILVQMPEPSEVDIVPENIPLDIVYEDHDLIVVNKPRGMVVHPAAGNWTGTLVNALMFHCGDSLSGINGALRPGIVHRIDKDTSGLLVVAKNDLAHQGLAAQIAAHTAQRRYQAIVIGSIHDDSGTIDKPIGRHKTDRKKMAIVPDGRPAITHYTVLRRYSGYTHMGFALETGRTHQIRVHMASIGHPIIGDPLYGFGKDRYANIGGQCLHAKQLNFVHPITSKLMQFETELPVYFTDILEELERKG